MITIVLLRKGATKTLSLNTTRQDMLSICQIFESTDDVTSYSVSEMDKNYFHKDMYLESGKIDWPKWIPFLENK